MHIGLIILSWLIIGLFCIYFENYDKIRIALGIIWIGLISWFFSAAFAGYDVDHTSNENLITIHENDKIYQIIKVKNIIYNITKLSGVVYDPDKKWIVEITVYSTSKFGLTGWQEPEPTFEVVLPKS